MHPHPDKVVLTTGAVAAGLGFLLRYLTFRQRLRTEKIDPDGHLELWAGLLFLLLGFTAVIVGKFDFLEPTPLIMCGIIGGVCLAANEATMLDKRITFRGNFLNVGAALVLGSLWIGLTIAAINCMFDAGPPHYSDALVVDDYYDTEGEYWEFTLAAFEDRTETVVITMAAETGEGVAVGDTVPIATMPGLFGVPWVRPVVH